MKNKEYKIETLSDIAKAVNLGNYKGFLLDFSQWLQITVHAKEIPGFDATKLSFEWNDDGQWGVLTNLNIEIAEPEQVTIKNDKTE